MELFAGFIFITVGVYFLYNWYKNRKEIYDVSIELEKNPSFYYRYLVIGIAFIAGGIFLSFDFWN